MAEPQLGIDRAGVPRDVPERLLGHPVEAGSDLRRDRLGRHGRIEPDPEAELLELRNQLDQRGGEAQVVEHRGVHPVGQPADLPGEVVQLLADPGQAHRLHRAAALELLEVVADHGDPLDQVIVQLARDPGPLLFLGGEDAPAELAGGGEEPTLLN